MDKIKNNFIDKEVVEMLRQSNYIENERSSIALIDAKKAWIYAIKNYKNIDVNYILKIHYLLLKHINPTIAGRIRDCNVRIGGEIKIFISEEDILNKLKLWLEDWNSLTLPKIHYWPQKKDWGEIARNAHVAFERIHPFRDGNGRVGRILYEIHRLKLGLSIHVIHEGEEQYQYYKWFKDDIDTKILHLLWKL